MGLLDRFKRNSTETNTVTNNEKPPVIKKELNECVQMYGNFIDMCSSDSLRGLLPYSMSDIEHIVTHPQNYPSHIRKLGKWAYNTNGAIKSGIDKMSTMHYLSYVLYDANSVSTSQKNQANKNKFDWVLRQIKYKQLIREILRCTLSEGTSFYYFETTPSTDKDVGRYMYDSDILQISEVNAHKFTPHTIALPADYCVRVTRRNNVDVVAFDLRYFQQFTGNELKRQVLTMPKEIQQAYDLYDKNGTNGKSWVVLNPNNTIVSKLGVSSKEQWGVPMSITALDEIMYANAFISTKRNVLSQINNNIIYEVFPVRGDGSGKSTLTEKQQQLQHDVLSRAVTQKANKQKTSVLSLAAGTTLGNLKIDTSIFDEKNEKSIKDNIPEAMGFAPSALYGGQNSGSVNYATALLNLQLVANHVYSIIESIVDELNKCINYNCIKDNARQIQMYVLPITPINSKDMFERCKALYADCGGAMTPLIAATGINPSVYLSLMNFEREQKFDEKYTPHQSMYTQSNKGGRPEVTDATNENTIISKNNNSNSLPSPND